MLSYWWIWKLRVINGSLPSVIPSFINWVHESQKNIKKFGLEWIESSHQPFVPKFIIEMHHRKQRSLPFHRDWRNWLSAYHNHRKICTCIYSPLHYSRHDLLRGPLPIGNIIKSPRHISLGFNDYFQGHTARRNHYLIKNLIPTNAMFRKENASS